MVEGQGHVSASANRDGVIDDHGALFDAAHAEDGDLGLIDHRQSEDVAEDAGVGDGEGAALNLIGLELLVTGSLREIIGSTGEPEQVQVVGLMHHRNDQTPVQSHGEADDANQDEPHPCR